MNDAASKQKHSICVYYCVYLCPLEMCKYVIYNFCASHRVINIFTVYVYKVWLTVKTLRMRSTWTAHVLYWIFLNLYSVQCCSFAYKQNLRTHLRIENKQLLGCFAGTCHPAYQEFISNNCWISQMF